MDTREKLTLANISGGKAEADFQEAYLDIVSTLKEGKKSTITLRIDIARLEGTSSMFKIATNVSAKYPASESSGVCQVTGDGYLLTDKPAPKAPELMLFSKGDAANG